MESSIFAIARLMMVDSNSKFKRKSRKFKIIIRIQYTLGLEISTDVMKSGQLRSVRFKLDGYTYIIFGKFLERKRHARETVETIAMIKKSSLHGGEGECGYGKY